MMNKIAFDLMRTKNFDFIKVRPKVVEMWTKGCFIIVLMYIFVQAEKQLLVMADLEMTDELRRFQDRRAEYIRAWKKQESGPMRNLIVSYNLRRTMLRVRHERLIRDNDEFTTDDKTVCDLRSRSTAAAQLKSQP